MTEQFLFSEGGAYSFISQATYLNLPKEILTRLNGVIDYDDLNDALLYSRLIHERTHFIQNINTTYGVWKTIVLRDAGLSASESIISYKNKGGKLIFPFENLINEENIDQFSYCTKYLYNLVCFVDGPIAIPRNKPEYFFEDVFPPKGSTHVHTIDAKGVKSILAGMELIEFQARFNEISWLNNNKQVNNNQRDEIISRIWADISSQIPLRISDRAFNKRDFESWVASFCIANIALNGEWPFPGIKSLNKLYWEDLHPGWRFEKMCNFISKNKIPVPKISEINQFQIDLCKNLNWLTPKEAMRKMLKELKQSYIWSFNSVFLSLVKHAYEYYPNNYYNFCGDISYFLKIFSSSFRGPNIRSTDIIDSSAWLKDVFLQLFFGNKVLCPLCFGYNHFPECKINKLIQNLNSY